MPDDILQEINKRLTMNLLIQGAAAHTFLTAHYLVKDELEAIRPGLAELYDRLVVSAYLAYWIGDVALVHGMPSRFWARAQRIGHPFQHHRLLAMHGGELSNASKRYLLARGACKEVVGVPVINSFQMLWLLTRVRWGERRHKQILTKLAKDAACQIWGIEESRLDAALTVNVRFGNLKPPNTKMGRFLQRFAVAFGGVERRNGQFIVVAKAPIWPILLHELVKGTAELICLHGLNTLDDETYRNVTDEADKIEYEVWLLQAGQEMWRKLLAVMPRARPVAEILMHIARLDPLALEHLMLAVIENPSQARGMLAQLPAQVKPSALPGSMELRSCPPCSPTDFQCNDRAIPECDENLPKGEPMIDSVSSTDSLPTFTGKVISVGGKSWTVPYPVHDARKVGNRIIVIYDYMSGPRGAPFQNLEAYDTDGVKLWTAPNPSKSPADAYVDFMSEAPLIVWNFACYRCTVDPATGRLIETVFTK